MVLLSVVRDRDAERDADTGMESLPFPVVCERESELNGAEQRARTSEQASIICMIDTAIFGVIFRADRLDFRGPMKCLKSFCVRA